MLRKGKTCKRANASSSDSNLGGCYKDEFNELRDEDEKCKVNEECFSQNCVNEKCKHVPDGADCKINDGCKPSSYCISGDKCKAYSKPGEKCEDDYDVCINGVR